MRRTWRAAIGRAAIGVVLALGCAQIFGIEEACEAGALGCGVCQDLSPQPFTENVDARCTAYCTAVTTTCLGDQSQFIDEDKQLPQLVDGVDDQGMSACMALCRFFPTETSTLYPTEVEKGNTVECRLAQLNLSEAPNCNAAGRMGGGSCGTHCDAYCWLLRAICPEDYCGEFAPGGSPAEAEQRCQADCARLQDDPSFDTTFGGRHYTDPAGVTPTVQCRLWHLGAAAIISDEPGPNIHCGHAIGVSDCRPLPAL